MTTVKSPLENNTLTLVLIYSLTWSDMGGVTQMWRADLTDTLICVRGEHTWDRPQPPLFFSWELIVAILSTSDIRADKACGSS